VNQAKEAIILYSCHQFCVQFCSAHAQHLLHYNCTGKLRCQNVLAVDILGRDQLAGPPPDDNPSTYHALSEYKRHHSEHLWCWTQFLHLCTVWQCTGNEQNTHTSQMEGEFSGLYLCHAWCSKQVVKMYDRGCNTVSPSGVKMSKQSESSSSN